MHLPAKPGERSGHDPPCNGKWHRYRPPDDGQQERQLPVDVDGLSSGDTSSHGRVLKAVAHDRQLRGSTA